MPAFVVGAETDGVGAAAGIPRRMLAAEKNRHHAASLSEALPAIVRRDVERSIQNQQRAIERLPRDAQEFVLANPKLARRLKPRATTPLAVPHGDEDQLTETIAGKCQQHRGPPLSFWSGDVNLCV